MKYTGVTARGIISPIFRQGDDLIESITEALSAAARGDGFAIDDGDILAVTESVVARVQGNYATCEQIAADVRAKLGGGTLGLVFPILSRNRFSVLLKAMAMGCEKLVIQLSYPSDEVGNGLITWEQLDEKGIDPYTTTLDEAGFRKLFGPTVHPFTGVDYVEFYKSFKENTTVIFSNDPTAILQHTDTVLCCDIHTRRRTAMRLKRAGAKTVLTMADILNASVDGSGYHEQFGLLGSNMATEGSVKLFPRHCQPVVDGLQARIKEKWGKHVEVLIYGDGCFKDPVGGIWEFADPVVSPAYTAGLEGTPNELKIKYFADSAMKDLSGEALAEALRAEITQKDQNLVGNMQSEGTTPRRYIDLIGSLCDLVSGSGDRGTPVIHIKGYFTNYASGR